MGENHTQLEISNMVRAEIKKDRIKFKDKLEYQLNGEKKLN